MIVIIDYGMGNVGSVLNALTYLKLDAKVSRDPQDIERASHLILPGVGAFAEGMKKLEEYNLIPLLTEQVIAKKKPILGICLGMQLLMESGEEHGHHQGLGWLKGTVRRFRVDETALRLPHIGWNEVAPKEGSKLLVGTEPNIFYFVHSYVVEPTDSSIVSGVGTYGEEFPATLEFGNIFGAQFHPERSQKSGITLLQNFANIHA